MSETKLMGSSSLMLAQISLVTFATKNLNSEEQ